MKPNIDFVQKLLMIWSGGGGEGATPNGNQVYMCLQGNR